MGFKWARLATVGFLIGCGGGGVSTGDSGGIPAAGSGGIPAAGSGGQGEATGGAAGSTGGAIGGAAGTAPSGTGGMISTGGAAAGGSAGTPGAGGAAAAGSGGGDLGCRPDLLLVQDKSGSMNNDPNDQTCTGGCAGRSKWALMTEAVTQVVASTDGIVNWGLKLFSDNNACDASQPPVAPVAAMNGAAIATALQRTHPAAPPPPATPS